MVLSTFPGAAKSTKVISQDVGACAGRPAPMHSLHTGHRAEATVAGPLCLSFVCGQWCSPYTCLEGAAGTLAELQRQRRRDSPSRALSCDIPAGPDVWLEAPAGRCSLHRAQLSVGDVGACCIQTPSQARVGIQR